MKIRAVARFVVLLLILANVTPLYAAPHAQVASDPEEIVAHIEQIKQASPTFSDNFRRESDTWYTGEDQDVAHFYKNGTYHIRVDGKSLLSWTVAKDSDVANFYLEVDTFHVAGPLENEIGIVFRHVDDDNFYLFGLGDDGLYTLRKKVAGKWTTLKDWEKAAPIITGEQAANTMGVLAEGSQISVLANGEVLATVEDDTFASGGVGLAGSAFDKGGIEVAFDDFNVWSVGGETAPTATEEATETASPADVSSHIEEIKSNEPAYSDDFAENNKDWGLSSTKDATVAYNAEALHVRIKSKNWLTWSSSKALTALNPANFYVEATVAHVSGPQDAEMGLIFRYVDENNFYAFFINQVGAYSLWKRIDGTFTKLVDWTEDDALDTGEGASNQLAVLAENTQITLLANDRVLTQTADDALSEGGVLLTVGTFAKAPLEGAFDDVSLWNLDESTITETPEETATEEITDTPEATDTPEETATPEATETLEPTATEEVTETATPIEIQDRLDEIHGTEPTFADDFSQDNKTWYTESDKDVTYAYTNQALHIHVKKANWSGWSTSEITGTNFLLEADTLHTAGPRDAEYGLAFRYVDGDNFYLFVVTRTGSYSLWKKVDNEWQSIVDWTDSDVIKGEAKAVNRLGVLAEGTQITLLINDVAVTQAEDDQFTSGNIALMVGTFNRGDADVAFDNVSLWELPATEENTETPEATATPEVTETEEATATPAATETVEPTATEEVTETTEVTETPEVTATPEATATPTDTTTTGNDNADLSQIKSKAPVFTDDFHRNNKIWRTTTDTAQVTLGYNQRAFDIKVDADQALGWSTGNVTVTNFLLEVDSQYVHGPTQAEYGVLFRQTDQDNFYFFGLDPAGRYGLWKVVDGQRTAIVDWTASSDMDTGANAVNRLSVLAVDTKLTLFVNGHQLTEAEDDTFATGNVALAAGTVGEAGVEAAFDNVKIWAVQ